MNKKQNEFFILRAIRGQMRGVNFLKGVIYRMEFLKGFLVSVWWGGGIYPQLLNFS